MSETSFIISTSTTRINPDKKPKEEPGETKPKESEKPKEEKPSKDNDFREFDKKEQKVEDKKSNPTAYDLNKLLGGKTRQA